MPDNVGIGALEEFLARLVRAQDELWDFARQSVDGAVAHHAPLRQVDLGKAHVHTYLAWQPRPGNPYGLLVGITPAESATQRAAPSRSRYG